MGDSARVGRAMLRVAESASLVAAAHDSRTGLIMGEPYRREG